ncbi:hypothetical protein BKA83DRAFT_4128300 [Pisolithus microcarpus]|nr:hypothetical protein BKA83DRAFT_4128300 [Pisolithus microcarpus]
MALHAIVLLDDYAALSLLVACIDFHALAGPINAVFAHVARVRRSRFLRCSGDTVQGVATRFLVTDPTQVAEASMSSTLTTRFVFGSPPLLLLPALQRSAAQIKHVDDEVRISPPSPPVLTISHARTIRAADQTRRRRGYNISPLPPTFLLLAVHERSVPLIKHVGDEVIIYPRSVPPLRLVLALQRSAAQIKHVDGEVIVADQAHQRRGEYIKHVDDKGSM